MCVCICITYITYSIPPSPYLYLSDLLSVSLYSSFSHSNLLSLYIFIYPTAILSLSLSTIPTLSFLFLPLSHPLPFCLSLHFPIYLKAAILKIFLQRILPLLSRPFQTLGKTVWLIRSSKWETNQALHTKWHIKIAATNNMLHYLLRPFVIGKKYPCLFIIRKKIAFHDIRKHLASDTFS